MRKVALCLIAYLSALSAHYEENDKKYVLPNQVFINENGLFVYHSNLWHRISGIHHDTAGLYYILSKEDYWICPICRAYNSEYAKECWRCDYPKSRS